MGSAPRPNGPDRTRSTGHRFAVGSLLTLAGLALGAGATWASAATAQRTGPGTPPGTPGRRGGGTGTGPGVEVFRPERLRRPVLVALGEQLVVHLEGPGSSSGYAWSAVTVPGLLSGPDGADGRSGDSFAFRAVQEGTAKLSFALRRPWEPAAARTVTLTVNVLTATVAA